MAPILLPYLIILGLLVLKSNRCASAWLIWLPLGAVIALSAAPLPFLSGGGSFLIDAFNAMAIGLAAVWLLSHLLRRQHRALTFLCLLAALLCFSVLAGLVRQSGSLMNIESLQIGVLLALGVFASSVALSLAGLICRARYRPVALYVWVLLFLMVTWALIAAPFFIFAMISSGGRISWSDFIGPVLGVSLGNFALLLPFLILSSVSSFYRERLKALLNAKTENQPEIAPLAETNLKT